MCNDFEQAEDEIVQRNAELEHSLDHSLRGQLLDHSLARSAALPSFESLITSSVSFFPSHDYLHVKGA